MALYIKNPDSAGVCCECSARPEPCNSCVSSNACFFSCSLLGVEIGEASLCGIPQNNWSGVTPINIYLTETWNGALIYRSYLVNAVPPCDGPYTEGTLTIGGSKEYSSTGCSFTDSRFGNFVTNPANQCVDMFGTDTTSGNLANGLCASCFTFPNAQQVMSTNQLVTLSNPDTNANAISRLINQSSWTNWVTGNVINDCMARYEERIGTTFAYNEARWKIYATGYLPNTGYAVNVSFYRAPYGTSSFVLYQTSTYQVSTDANGNTNELIDSVPNAEGFDTYASTDCILSGISL